MNLNSKLMNEFGERLVRLRNGDYGLRATLEVAVREPAATDPMAVEPVLDFVASDDSIDRYDEVIDQAGWQLDNFRRNPVIVDSHDYSSVARILGRAVDVKVEENRLLNRTRFALENPLGVMSYRMAKAGFIKAQSVGFIALDWKYGNEPGAPYRTFLKQDLIEISLVAVPANANAVMSAIKTGAIGRSDLTDTIEFLRILQNETRDNQAVGDGHSGAEAAAHHAAQLSQLTELMRSTVEVARRA